jgi:hypothetical protein
LKKQKILLLFANFPSSKPLQHMKKLLLLTLTVLSVKAFAQMEHRFKIGTQIPFQYNIGYENRFTGRFSANLQAGILTKPYDQAIINIMSKLGVGDVYIRVLESAFKFGFVGDLSGRYHFGKNYTGIYGQFIRLSGQDTPSGLVESAFKVNLSNYPRKRNQPIPAAGENLFIQSSLVQLGILYGRRFLFKDPQWEIHAEFSISKNISSQTKVTSETREVVNLQTLINNELVSLYKDYAYIPSLNVYLVYKLGKQ